MDITANVRTEKRGWKAVMGETATPEREQMLPGEEVGAVFRAAEQLAEREFGTSHPWFFLAFGGPITFGEQELVSTLLEIVNQPSPAIVYQSPVGSLYYRHTVGLPDLLRASDRREQLTQWLTEIALDRAKAANRHTAVWTRRRGTVIIVRPLEQPERIIVAGSDAAIAHVLLLLVDARSTVGRVRRCQLETCGRFFLDSDLSRRGTPLKYCEVAHRQEREQRLGVERIQARRAGMSVDDFRSAKVAGQTPAEWKKLNRRRVLRRAK
jgi:hypothetical protein